MLDLTAIKARHANEYKSSYKLGAAFIQAQKDIDSLIAEVERLAIENTKLEAYYQQYTALVMRED